MQLGRLVSRQMGKSRFLKLLYAEERVRFQLERRCSCYKERLFDVEVGCQQEMKVLSNQYLIFNPALESVSFASCNCFMFMFICLKTWDLPWGKEPWGKEPSVAYDVNEIKFRDGEGMGKGT